MSDRISHILYHLKNPHDPRLSQSHLCVINECTIKWSHAHAPLSDGMFWECVAGSLWLLGVSLMMECSGSNEGVAWRCVSEQVWQKCQELANQNGISWLIAIGSD